MRIVPVDLGTRLVPYEEAWALQREIHAQVAAGEAEDTLLLVEHEPVYTAGRRTAAWDRPVDGTPVVDVDRGGRITWHGPGQLVGYPIVRLAEPVDVVRYVRRLEQAVMDVCASFGLETIRVEDRSGVWLPATEERSERKICAIGVRVAKGVTMHGFALNCTPDLGWFDRIVPCGISDADVTSLSVELGREVPLAEAVEPTVRFLEAALADVRWAQATSPAVDLPTKEPV
ncbi:lipoyl(octanoyl) transferase LipB [Demequina sp. SYSU T00192]|uniref:Octanoyltransferase n=1 Tax=Demequina litoralis TaxID=3051660 RepID=A0ABT8G6D6_9MICO|nr:lipoyl(octanoyl) transferase LipB [Demequina sp. SYSU T00192]MDN4474627.1 lipoyl(octanoyl) transferase LipB [Demequina sp. SYSU T00192]